VSGTPGLDHVDASSPRRAAGRRLGRLYEVAVPASGGAATVVHVSGLAERAMALAAYRPPYPVCCAGRSYDASASYMALQLTGTRGGGSAAVGAHASGCPRAPTARK
jgi:hypothetical protein